MTLGLGILANTGPAAPLGVLGWMIQLGALGLLAWYFLRVEPQQRREEREARQRELELLWQHRSDRRRADEPPDRPD